MGTGDQITKEAAVGGLFFYALSDAFGMITSAK